MFKIIGAVFVAVVVTFLPVNISELKINEDIDYVRTYSSTKVEIDKYDNGEDLVDPFLSSSYFFWWPGCGGSYDEATVFTPNGTKVTVYIKKRTMSNSLITDANKKGDSMVPQATRIADSSIKYNCHSYAWYQQSTENQYWMNDPSAYYTDGSYIQVSTPHKNDRICYFDRLGTNIHSGIITEIYSGSSNGVCGGSDLVKVISKWGELGLYEHRGDHKKSRC